MAVKQEHLMHEGDRVQIKDSLTHMYPSARVYSQGWVRHTDHDDLGYPMVFIEWDKDHWAYSGENDGWALEAHFDLIEEKMSKEDNLIAALAKIVDDYRSEEPEEARVIDEANEGPSMNYDEVLKRAYLDAKEGDAYIIFVAKSEEFNDTEVIAPHIYMHSKREDAALMLDATVADVLAQQFGNLVMERIKAIREEEDGTPSA